MVDIEKRDCAEERSPELQKLLDGLNDVFESARRDMTNLKALEDIAGITVNTVEGLCEKVEQGKLSPEQAAEIVADAARKAAEKYYQLRLWVGCSADDDNE